MPLPDELTSATETYLKDHRPFLRRRRGRWTAPIANALWVSQDGSALGDRSTYQQLVSRTRAGFGRPVNPHLFRDCVATSIAIDDPDHVRIAVRRHQELVIGIRNGTIEISCDKEDAP